MKTSRPPQHQHGNVIGGKIHRDSEVEPEVKRLCATEALLIAIAEDANELVGEALIVAGANVNAADAAGWTPLHFAASRGQAEFAELLIDNGANVTVRDAEGRTPLELAQLNGHETTADLLREYAAEPCSCSAGEDRGAE